MIECVDTNWLHVAVGFVAGVVFSIIVYEFVQHFRNRNGAD